MITIHNSSLASIRNGYIKPEQLSVDKRQAQTTSPEEQRKKEQGTQASTPDQIQAAITQTGLSKESNLSNENDRRTNIALKTYNQTRNQQAQAQLENIISRVDYYA